MPGNASYVVVSAVQSVKHTQTIRSQSENGRICGMMFPMGSAFARRVTAAKRSQSRNEVSVHSIDTAKCVKSCQRCGKKIERTPRKKDSLKYCGKPCYFAAVREGKQRFHGRIRNEWSALVDWAYSRSWKKPKAECKKRRSTYKTRPPCEVCGKETNHRTGRFCSYECTKLWRGVRKCDMCGENVENANAFSIARCDTCKQHRKRKINRESKVKYGRNHRSRARKAGVAYTSFRVLDIYERDSWICQLCGKACKKRWTVCKSTGRPDPRSPTLDHIVPLSKGGPHEPRNAQLACFACNTAKGSSLEGQKRLFAY